MLISTQDQRLRPIVRRDAERHRPAGRGGLEAPVHVPAQGLSGSDLADRFCFWRGRSGRRYAFSVYRAGGGGDSLPFYADAVIMTVRRAANGARAIVALGDTGSLPELSPLLLAAAAQSGAGDELHIHLLARGRAERQAVMADLAAASPQF